MYRKRQNKGGGFTDFLDQAIEQAKEKASSLTQSLQSATTEGMDSFKEKTNEVAAEASVMTNDTPVPPVSGGKSRRKPKRSKRKRTKQTKRTKRRSSVRQRR
jgi:hypothetical protein